MFRLWSGRTSFVETLTDEPGYCHSFFSLIINRYEFWGGGGGRCVCVGGGGAL